MPDEIQQGGRRRPGMSIADIARARTMEPSPQKSPVPTSSALTSEVQEYVDIVDRCHFLSFRALRRVFRNKRRNPSLEVVKQYVARACQGENAPLGVVDPGIAAKLDMKSDTVYSRAWIRRRLTEWPYNHIHGGDELRPENIIAAALYRKIDMRRLPFRDSDLDGQLKGIEIEPGVTVDWDGIIEYWDNGLISFLGHRGGFYSEWDQRREEILSRDA